MACSEMHLLGQAALNDRLHMLVIACSLEVKVLMRVGHGVEDVVPVSDFNARADEWLKRLSDTGQPLMITRNGETAAILLSPDAYDRLSDQARFISGIGEGIRDAEEGRLTDHAEVVERMKARYGEP